MASRGVVSLELVVYLRRCAQCLFKAVSPYQRRRSVHLVKIKYLLRDINVRSLVIKLLLCQLCAEYMAQLVKRAWLQRSWVEQRRRLVLHVCTYIVPLLRHLIFFKIDLVRDLFAHCGSFLSVIAGEQTKNLPHFPRDRIFTCCATQCFSFRCLRTVIRPTFNAGHASCLLW